MDTEPPVDTRNRLTCLVSKIVVVAVTMKGIKHNKL